MEGGLRAEGTLASFNEISSKADICFGDVSVRKEYGTREAVEMLAECFVLLILCFKLESTWFTSFQYQTAVSPFRGSSVVSNILDIAAPYQI